MRSLARRLAFARIGWLVVAPAPLLAQDASIVGTVRDPSGAVLPGVTVEAASPALIEKVRTTVTDGSGQYRITNLAPGTYTVTFSLSGFATLKQEAVPVNTEITVTVNADLKVGALEETLTVTGATAAQQTSATRTISLLQTGQQYGKGMDQLDVRVAKPMAFGRSQLTLMADVYNAFNSDWVFSQNGTLGTNYTVSSNWLRPTNVLTARMFKAGFQFDF